MAKRAVAFGATAKPGESLRFYRDVLELSLIEDGQFAMLFDAFGTHLRLQKVDEVVAVPYTSFGFEVDNAEAEAKRLADHDVEMLRYGHFEQSPAGVWTSPAGAKVIWFVDPDGTTISMTELPD